MASPFAAGGARSLDFKPKFAVATNGRTSKANGASLDARVTYPPFKAGGEANIAYVKVAAAQTTALAADDAAEGVPGRDIQRQPGRVPGRVGDRHRPRIDAGAAGRTGRPGDFVSHGGEAFPSLVVVLQGEGVRVDLTGTTFISKTGITSSTFKTVPDVPVSSFELYLPEGPYSALAANANLCAAQAKLKMPTEFVAQNGATIHESTQLAVTGCAKAKAKKKKTKANRSRGAARGRTTPMIAKHHAASFPSQVALTVALVAACGRRRGRQAAPEPTKFLLARHIGFKVDMTTEGDICTVASGEHVQTRRRNQRTWRIPLPPRHCGER